MIGKTVSHYKIVEKLGEGGAGVVYKAEDTRLKRTVALKFLRTDAFDSDEHRQRLLLEAQAVASIDHPNICAVHEIGEVDGRTFIVMAYVEGPNLRERASSGPLGIDEVVSIAIQAAEGIQAAHRKDLVHRDVKSANIVVDPEGRVKVLDFGIARLQSAARITQTGTTRGTPAYMSPEQASGHPIDTRTDVWSLGVVLYEIATGELPFQGDYEPAIVYSILNEEPRLPSDVRPELPPGLDSILAKALAKEPPDRYQHIEEFLGDLRLLQKGLLAEIADDGPSPDSLTATDWSVTGRHPKKGASSRARWAIAGVVAAGLIGVGLWVIRSGDSPAQLPPEYELLRLTGDSGFTASPAISRDGRLLAYSSDRGGRTNLDIWVQQIPGGEPIQRTRDEADDHQAAFSPDGSQIVFRSERSGGGIYITAALGGNERLLADNGRHPQFSPDGQWIAYSVGDFQTPSSVYVVPAAGGQPTRLQTNLAWTLAPAWTPDGNHLLFLGSADATVHRLEGQLESVDLWVAPKSGGAAVATGLSDAMMEAKIRHADWREYRPPVWDPMTKRLVFTARSGDTTNPWSIAISQDTWKVSGMPRRLTTGAAFGEASVADDGRIVVSSSSMTTNVWRLRFNPAQRRFPGLPERVTQDSADNAHPTISPDGKTLVFVSTRTGNWDVWKRDLETGREVQLTANPAEEYRAMISPDGTRVAFGRRDGSKVDLFVSPISGAGETLVADDIGGLAGWSPDGTKIMYWWGQPIRFSMIALEGGEPSDVVTHAEYNIHTARFSPDGRYISFKLVIGPGQESLFIAPVNDNRALEQDTWIQVTEGSLDARSWWSPDGNTLYFLSWRDGFLCIWERPLDGATKRPAGEARSVQHFHGARRIRQPGDFGYALTGSELYFGLHETAANIWMAVPQAPL